MSRNCPTSSTRSRFSHGIDPTRATDIPGSDPARNGEPDGELGLGAPARHGPSGTTRSAPPSDPQAGNIPGGRRDVLRTAAATSVHGGGHAKAGSTISLSFTVTNSSPHAITNVRLAPTFPTGGKVGAKFKGAGAAFAGLTCDLYGCMLASLGKDSSIVVVLDFELLWASEATEVEIGALVGYEGSSTTTSSSTPSTSRSARRRRPASRATPALPAATASRTSPQRPSPAPTPRTSGSTSTTA